MTKRQFGFLLGLVGQAGCVVYDEALRRESSDAATDGPRDGAAGARDAGLDGARSDVVTADVEASRDASFEMGVTEDVVIVEDATPPSDAADARDAIAEPDATVGPNLDASTLDGAADARADTDIDAGARDGTGSGDDTLVDRASDPPIIGCSVDFTVSGVTWDDDGSTESDGGARVVRLVGDVSLLGAWAPGAGLTMTEKAPGAWSVSVALADALSIEFKFVKVEAGLPPEWEQWLPFDSNRSLLVDCAAEGGTIWVDAATDAGPANRAVGRSYGGAFGIRPLDATK